MATTVTSLHFLIILFTSVKLLALAEEEAQFIHNGFQGASLHLGGIAKIHPNGLLQLTNTSKQQIGRAFFPLPLKFNTSSAVASQYLGLFNVTNNGNSSNHVFAVELDTILSPDLKDTDGNHVGVDAMQVWIDYDDVQKLINVTVAPLKSPKPSMPLLSTPINLSSIFLDLEISELPSLPPRKKERKTLVVIVLLSLTTLVIVLVVLMGAGYIIRKLKFEELREEWEGEYGPQRFSYKDLYKATKGFKDKELLGAGGFGKFLFSDENPILTWPQRYHILRGVASRDFGLAKLYDHDTNPQTTHVVGTLQGYPEGGVLLDWVLECWKRGAILLTSDPRLEGHYVAEEMELVLKLGLLCSSPIPAVRPSMRQVMQYLNGDAPLPEIPRNFSSMGTFGANGEESAEVITSFPSSSGTTTIRSFSSSDSILNQGR
ncbi:unnamed protein product, partial [Vitis vinifera]